MIEIQEVDFSRMLKAISKNSVNVLSYVPT